MAVFLALALAAGLAERGIPFDFAVPGVRLGLGNVVILTALYLFRFRDALLLTLLKCVLTALFAGSFTSFAYSLSGSALSLLVMAAAKTLAAGKASPLGVSALGAVFHNIGQLAAAAAVMGTVAVFAYLPVLMAVGTATGIVVGLLAGMVIPRLERILDGGG